MSASSVTDAQSSIDSLPLASSSTSQSINDSPPTSCPDSPKSSCEEYFPVSDKIPSLVAGLEASRLKVNSVCFVGAGFVGTYSHLSWIYFQRA